MIANGYIVTPSNDEGLIIANGVPQTRHNGLVIVNGLSDRIDSYIGSPTARLSTVNGNAFAWISEKNLAPYLGHKIVVTDSAGKEATGYIKEPDAVEAFGSEIFANPDFEGTPWTSGWGFTTPGDGAVAEETVLVHGGGSALKLIANTTGFNSRGYQTLNYTSGKLYKYTGWSRGDGTTSGRIWVTDFLSLPPRSVNIPGTTYAQFGFYFVATETAAKITYVYVGSLANAVAYFDDVSMKEVTHVGANGVHVVSAKDGTTRNWASIDSGFDPNDIDFVNVYDK